MMALCTSLAIATSLVLVRLISWNALFGNMRRRTTTPDELSPTKAKGATQRGPIVLWLSLQLKG